MNSLPFGQLKSFLKILIGVQYESGTDIPENEKRPPRDAAGAFARMSNMHRKMGKMHRNFTKMTLYNAVGLLYNGFRTEISNAVPEK